MTHAADLAQRMREMLRSVPVTAIIESAPTSLLRAALPLVEAHDGLRAKLWDMTLAANHCAEALIDLRARIAAMDETAASLAMVEEK